MDDKVIPLQIELPVPRGDMSDPLQKLLQLLEKGELEKAARMLGVPKITKRHQPYKHSRWARCVSCHKKQKVRVYAMPGGRMRDQRCACGGRLRAGNWKGWR